MFKELFSYLPDGIKGCFFAKRIYLDYASLTPIDPRILGEVERFSSIQYANPSSIYKEGVMAKEAMKSARSSIASILHSGPEEIYFTSGGTESNNIAILGTVESLHEKGVEYEKMHVLISVIEHSSIRECANTLSAKGVKVELIPVNKEGIVDVREIEKMIKPNTVIVSVMTVNNEIGSVQPVREIAKAIRHWKSKNIESSAFSFQNFEYPIFHTDASQAPLYTELHVEKLGVDLLTLDGTKVYGPRGVGLLFVKKDTPILPIIFGGGQENGLRSGTENVAGIKGLVKALEIAEKERSVEIERVGGLRNLFIQGLKKIRSDITFNGPQTEVDSHLVADRADKSDRDYPPYILNVSIPKIDNEFFLLQLDAKGIACSTKSSCLGDEEESYVLKAIGADSKQSLRFSFGRWTTKKEIEKTMNVISGIIGKKGSFIIPKKISHKD
jgi:cysteine desulfurase